MPNGRGPCSSWTSLVPSISMLFMPWLSAQNASFPKGSWPGTMKTTHQSSGSELSRNHWPSSRHPFPNHLSDRALIVVHPELPRKVPPSVLVSDIGATKDGKANMGSTSRGGFRSDTRTNRLQRLHGPKVARKSLATRGAGEAPPGGSGGAGAVSAGADEGCAA